LKLSKVQYWTAEEEKILRRFPAREAARRLNRTLSSVMNRRHRIGVTVVERATRSWTAQEDALLGRATDAEVAFRKASMARPGGRRLDQTATILRWGLGAESDRYSG